MSAVVSAQTKPKRSSNMTVLTDIKSQSSGYPYSLIRKRALASIQKVKNLYGLEEGMHVLHDVFISYGTGIIDGFEVNAGSVAVRVKWPNLGSFNTRDASGTATHGPGILSKIDVDKDERSGPNQGFKAHKHLRIKND